MNKLDLLTIFKKHSIIGVVGNRSTGKSMTALGLLIDLKKKYPQIPIYVYGIEEQVATQLKEFGFNILLSKKDITDVQLTNCVMFVDEFAMVYNTATKNKQLDKLSNFFDRLEHRKIKFIFGTAREKFFNTFACSRMTCAIVKQIEYDSLVNATWLKDNVKSIKSMSEYRLESPVTQFFITSKDDTLTQRYASPYYKELDTKQFEQSIFNMLYEKNYEKSYDKKSERVGEKNCDIVQEKNYERAGEKKNGKKSKKNKA
jgi:ADP-heptose:LPS heptosyltransferase